jgi:outer membrane immunogenic protein
VLPFWHGPFEANHLGLTSEVAIRSNAENKVFETKWSKDDGMEGNAMKRFLLVAVSLVALVGLAAPASAADMAVKAPPAPVLPPIYNWSGFYIGANGGWGQSHNCWDFVGVAGAIIADGCRDRSGGLVGGQIGYRWQTNQFVFGLEAQGDWADLSNTRVSLINPLFSTRTKTDGIGLFTGQIGYAWNATLLYVKGGAAVTSNRFSILDTFTGTELAAASSTRWGGTVGVGLEYGFAPNWSVGVEYDHLFMGDSNNSFSVVNPIVAGALNRISQDVDMVTLRINYRFGWGTNPVIARY